MKTSEGATPPWVRIPKHPRSKDHRAELLDIRNRLTIAMAAALRGQNADSDTEIATTLQRCVGDELDRQVERLDALARSKP